MRTLAKIMSAVVVTVAASVLYAQPGVPPKPDAPVNDMQTKTSLGDMREDAKRLGEQMTIDAQRITAMREKAQKAKDVIKLSCVNDKVVELKATQNIADDQQSQLDQAMTDGNESRHALFAAFEASAGNVARLREEAASCIGGPDLYKQESGNSYEAPDFPDDPNTMDPTNEGTIEPPAYASPFE